MPKDDPLVRRIPAPLDSGWRCALLPTNAADDERLSKIPLGEVVSISVWRGRSLQMWRLYWAVLTHVAQASKFENAEQLYVELKLRLGYYDWKQLSNGKVTAVPHSFNFANKSQDEAQKLFDESMQIICEVLLPGINRDDLIAEVMTMMGSPSPVDPGSSGSAAAKMPPGSGESASLEVHEEAGAHPPRGRPRRS